MSVYHTSFTYLGINSIDKNLMVAHFDADQGESETFLNMEPIYTDNAFGTRRLDYGAKYSSVAVFRLTVVKPEGNEFSVIEIRDCLKWLTGARSNSSLDLLFDDEIKYSFTGRFTNAWQYKMDAKTVGLILEFTSIAPWAYSPLQTITQTIYGSATIQIDNQSDDLYEFVYLKTIYENTSGDSLKIENTTTGEVTEVNNLVANEIVTIDSNMMITSDKPSKTFGNSFNFVFPRLVPGVNELSVTGTGNITFQYIMYLKVGDCAIDINAKSDPICDEYGNIQIDTLDWSRIVNTPTTLSGYHIQNAYTKTEIDKILANFTQADVYTKTEIDNMFDNIDFPDTYTKTEIDNKLSAISVDIDKEELDAMLAEVLV